MDDTVKRNSAVADLWEQIIAAQTRYAAAIEQVNELKAELGALKTWDSEKQRYELKDLGGGFYTYVIKQGQEQGEPLHAICANCYQRGFKSILQTSGHMLAAKHSWNCPACNTQIKYPGTGTMAELIKRARQQPT